MHGCAPAGMGHKPAVANGCSEHMCGCLGRGLQSEQACGVECRPTSRVCAAVSGHLCP